MNKNKIFNFKRFSLLLRNDLLLNNKQYLYTMVGGLILFYILILYNITRTYILEYAYNHYHTPLMYGVMLLAVFIGLAFPMMRTKSGTAGYLLLPGSAFEKYLSQFLIRIVGGTIAFTILFWLAAQMAYFSALQTNRIQEFIVNGGELSKFKYVDFLATFSDNNSLRSFNTFFLLLSCGIFAFSSRLLFNRFSFPKAGIAAVAIVFAGKGIFVCFSHLFYPETKGFDIKLPDFYLLPKADNIMFFTSCLAFTLWIVLLFVGYFKLKEKRL